MWCGSLFDRYSSRVRHESETDKITKLIRNLDLELRIYKNAIICFALTRFLKSFNIKYVASSARNIFVRGVNHCITNFLTQQPARHHALYCGLRSQLYSTSERKYYTPPVCDTPKGSTSISQIMLTSNHRLMHHFPSHRASPNNHFAFSVWFEIC